MKKRLAFRCINNFSILFKPIFLIFLVFLSATLAAQQKIIQLYNGAAPGSEKWIWNEKETNKNMLNTRIAYNVTHPTLTVFLPKSGGNGTSVIVCPGGGFHVLLVDLEGENIANELTKKGVTVFVLRYRLAHSLTDDPWQEMMTAVEDSAKSSQEITPIVEFGLEDTKTAIIYVRQHAGDFGVDVKRIGLMGFSAGGYLAAYLAYNYTPETRPDFVAPIYAPAEGIKKTNVQQDAPPMFIAAATNDHLVPVSNSVCLYNDWATSKHSVELHLYSKSDHGLQGFPANNWIIRFEEWLDVQGFLKSRQ
ncbi:MAG: alpha/beta hydrolase [Bacteroidota bacterium]|nr:alpha/beta hydrolase [Bacteroidota bacterium]